MHYSMADLQLMREIMEGVEAMGLADAEFVPGTELIAELQKHVPHSLNTAGFTGQRIVKVLGTPVTVEASDHKVKGILTAPLRNALAETEAHWYRVCVRCDKRTHLSDLTNEVCGDCTVAEFVTKRNQPKPKSAKQVYLISDAETMLVKIGTSAKPERRVADLQTGSASELTLLWTHPGSYAEERRLHTHFAAQRRTGEWFDLGADPVTAIMAAMPKATKTPIRELMAW